MRHEKSLDGGYFNLDSLMSLKGFISLKSFQDNYDIVYNFNDDKKIFFNANKFQSKHIKFKGPK